MIDYKQAVTEFLHLDEEIQADQWRQAELTWEQVEAGVPVKQWAEAIKKSKSHVYNLYGVWAAQSTGKLEATVSFNEAYQRTAEGENWEEKQTLRRAKSALAQLTPGQQNELITSVLRTPPGLREMPERITSDPERTRRNELIARERELAEQQDKDRLLGNREILSELSHYRDRGDALVERWARRGVSLGAAREAFFAELAGLQRVIDHLRALADGQSVDDELNRLLSEEQTK